MANKIEIRSKKDILKILSKLNEAILWYDNHGVDFLSEWLDENKIDPVKLTSCTGIDSSELDIDSSEFDMDALMNELDDLGYSFDGHTASIAYTMVTENKSSWEGMTIPHFMSLYENWLKRDIIVNDLDDDSLPHYCCMGEGIGYFIADYLGNNKFDEEKDMDKNIDLIHFISCIEPGEDFGMFINGGACDENKEWLRNQYIRHEIDLPGNKSYWC